MKRARIDAAAIWLTILMTALVVGGVSYYVASDRIQGLRNQLEEQENLQVATSADLSHLRLPLVTYKRGGLADERERQEIKEKVLDPFFAYHNENRINAIAALVEIPENQSQAYQFTFLFATEQQLGHEAFLFGIRGQELDYWRPFCMGPCEFSESFKEKYPQIVSEEAQNQ